MSETKRASQPEVVRPPMPIIYLAHNVHRHGGQERAAYEVIDRLKRRRPMTVIALACEVPDVPHVAVRAPRRPVLAQTAWYNLVARRELRRRLSANGPVLTTGIGSAGGPVDVVVAQYCQQAYRQSVGPVRGNGRLRRWWQQLNMAWNTAEERAVYRSPQLRRVIAVSHGVGRELIECYGVDPAIVRYIPNGVDLSTFRPLDGGVDAKRLLRIELGLPTDGLLACFVGGDWRRKGLRPAVESLRDLPGVRLVVVGAGDRAEFTAIAAGVDAVDRVHFVGKRPDPQRYLQAADVYLFPSMYEAFSLSCIEAAACGLPLVVTKINGSEELVEHGVNGFFVDHDPASIANHLSTLSDDPALRHRMAARSADIGRTYDWKSIADAHEMVYAELDAIATQGDG